MNATMTLDQKKHYPVMLDQILSIISPQHGGSFIDCTFGGGGYSSAILQYPDTKVFAIDRDKLAKKYASNLTKKFPKRFTFFQEKFSNLNKVISSELNPKAIIFDLGLSSNQLSDLQRGFSFNSKGTLSMQMGDNKYSAYDVVNSFDKRQLANIIKILGEEKDAKIIASKIVNYRLRKKIETSEELSSIIKSAKKKKYINKKNPSTKTFQALRIFINQELSELISGLIAATKLLSKGGILIIVSFHSLEDRIVKFFFSIYSNFKKNPSRYFPITESKKNLFKLLSKKALTPKVDEIKKNIRSRSAKLRFAIRTNDDFFFPTELEKKFQNYIKLEGTDL